MSVSVQQSQPAAYERATLPLGVDNQPTKPKVARRRQDNPAAVWLAIVHLCPWLQKGFKGRRATILEMLPRAYSWQAVQHWQKHRRKCPPSVAIALAQAIRDRAQQGLALAEELEAYAVAEEARPKRLVGFMKRNAER